VLLVDDPLRPIVARPDWIQRRNTEDGGSNPELVDDVAASNVAVELTTTKPIQASDTHAQPRAGDLRRGVTWVRLVNVFISAHPKWVSDQSNLAEHGLAGIFRVGYSAT
jgi:hypothetical protein